MIDGDENITSHSSTVMLHVDGKRPFSVIDAQTIKDQIEGTYNYLQTVPGLLASLFLELMPFTHREHD